MRRVGTFLATSIDDGEQTVRRDGDNAAEKQIAAPLYIAEAAEVLLLIRPTDSTRCAYATGYF